MTCPVSVLVCRAEPGASRTAAALTHKGYLAVVEPLLTVQPIAVASPTPGPDSHIALSSPNAADRLADLITHRHATIYATGQVTANHARHAGFTDILTANGNQNDLARLIAATLPKGASIHHPANRAAGHSLADRLARHGIAVHTLHTYCTIPVDHPGPTLSALLSNPITAPHISAILIHSGNGASALASLIPAGCTLPVAVFAISNRAAEPLVALQPPDIVIARSPDEDALLDALGAVVPPSPHAPLP